MVAKDVLESSDIKPPVPLLPDCLHWNADYNRTIQLECGPMPNVMVALPNIGGALRSTPQSLAAAHYYTLNDKT